MTFRRLRRAAAPPESPYPAPPPQGAYAPPPGPPPGWDRAFGLPPPDVPRRQQNGMPRDPNRTAETERRVRILSHDEEIQRLFKVCSTAKGNAQLLRETIAYTKPEDLKENELIDEFRKKCRQSQKFITSTIPWATAEAEHSRARASSEAETNEEELLAQLLAANEEIIEALQSYKDSESGLVQRQDMEKQKSQSKLQALDAITRFESTPYEMSLVERIFEIGAVRGGDSISTPAFYKIMSGSRLPPQTLAAIYDIANVEENKMLSRHCVGVTIRLIGHVQAGTPVAVDLVMKAGPLAQIDGLETSQAEPPQPFAGHSSPSSSITRSPPLTMQSGTLPPLTSEDRQKFMKIFDNSQPVNGIINATQARELFTKSRLPRETLSRIWDLADIQKRGALDAQAFTIAMYLIQGCMAGAITSIPPSLPPSLYSEAALAMSKPDFDSLYMPSPSSSTGPSGSTWIVPADVRSSADAFFDAFDERRQGYLDRGIIQAHLRQTGLPEEVVQRIWKLADKDSNGQLSREEFGIAMYLVQMAERREPLPDVLPKTNASPPRQLSPPPVPSIQAITEDLIGLNFEPHSGPIQMPVPSIDGRPVIAPSSSPPPLPPRTPLSPATASIFQPHWPGVSPASPSTPSTPPGSSLPPPTQRGPLSIPPGWNWDVSPVDKVNSDKFFDTLDPWKQGYLEGDAAVAFMSKSKLATEDLGRIWDLADINRNGRLTKEEFAVAMYLIRGKLAGGEIPELLPASLMPPANLPALPDNGAAPSAAHAPAPATPVPAAPPASAPVPPLPPRSNTISTPTSNLQPSVLEAQAIGEETVSPQRAATPPPPYEEPDVAHIASP
ncbi:hypothetical protein BDY19DRAFT_447463 [Irpex rosettiformis]|uniref:Uncharacterized protein n=1 Tax=Irpex rosettiformis TaxID=378272 RepID=A0ACB8TTU8_9APHY|nr:hypothetical protein BDY19DRAFT_447463 [Irpex rosettiformis]